MVQGCILSMSVLERTILPGLPGVPGTPLKPISPFGMSRGGTEFSKKKRLNNRLNCSIVHFSYRISLITLNPQ